MDLGIQIADECLQVYEEMRMEKKWQYIIYRNVNNKRIEVEKKGDRGSAFEEFVASLPQDDSRYCVFDYHIVFPDGRVADKIIYTHWCPDNASVKVKMVSASTNQFFQNKIQGIAVTIQSNDYSSLDKAEIEKKIK